MNEAIGIPRAELREDAEAIGWLDTALNPLTDFAVSRVCICFGTQQLHELSAEAERAGDFVVAGRRAIMSQVPHLLGHESALDGAAIEDKFVAAADVQERKEKLGLMLLRGLDFFRLLPAGDSVELVGLRSMELSVRGTEMIRLLGLGHPAMPENTAR